MNVLVRIKNLKQENWISNFPDEDFKKMDDCINTYMNVWVRINELKTRTKRLLNLFLLLRPLKTQTKTTQ